MTFHGCQILILPTGSSLDIMADNTKNLLGFWNRGSYESYRKLVELDAQTQGYKEECHRKMDKASGKA